MLIDGEDKTDYWKVVLLDFRSDTGYVGSRSIHSQAVEMNDLKDELLDKLKDLESSSDPMYDDFTQEELNGLPDEAMISREYTHKLVSLFAISCGIIEKQLEILLSQYLIPDSRRGGIVADCFEGRGLYENLEFAKAAGAIGNGIYSDSTDVRKTRNKLVHNPNFRLSIDSYNSHRQRLKKCTRAPEKIHKQIEKHI